MIFRMCLFCWPVYWYFVFCLSCRLQSSTTPVHQSSFVQATCLPRCHSKINTTDGCNTTNLCDWPYVIWCLSVFGVNRSVKLSIDLSILTWTVLSFPLINSFIIQISHGVTINELNNWMIINIELINWIKFILYKYYIFI